MTEVEIPWARLGPRVEWKSGASGAWSFGRHYAPEIATIVRAAAETAPSLVENTLIITEGWRPGVPQASLHPACKAVDIRAIDDAMRPGAIVGEDDEQKLLYGARWAARLREKLGTDFDVVFGPPNHLNHIHIERDVKRRPYRPVTEGE